jgi:glycosyltransferase involved in cell wall biosynthesis
MTAPLKIILLTRHYPPERSGGSRRPSALAAALRRLGHNVTVVGPRGSDDACLLPVDHPVFPNLPATNSDVSKPRTSPFHWARTWLLLPDAEIRWAMRALSAIRQADLKPDWIITTSPPESLHVAGALLKSTTPTKWLADVRDLWLERPSTDVRKNALRRWIEAQIACWALSKADALVGVSPAVLNEAKRLSKRPAMRSAVIGHFATHFDGLARVLPSDRFNIVHTGSIKLSNPLSDIASLIVDFEQLVALRPNAHLWLAGRLADSEVQQLEHSRAFANITLLGQLSMDDARALQAGADALAIVSGPDSHALPGKFSEYMTTGSPILLAGSGPWTDLVPADSTLTFLQAANLPKSTKYVDNLNKAYTSEDGAKDFLTLMNDVSQLSQP